MTCQRWTLPHYHCPARRPESQLSSLISRILLRLNIHQRNAIFLSYFYLSLVLHIIAWVNPYVTTIINSLHLAVNLTSDVSHSTSLHQDVPHGFDVAIISTTAGCVSTRVGVIRISSSTKPDSGVTGRAVIVLVSNDTNSCFGMATTASHSVEPFLVTVGLQRYLGANQRPPRVTQWSGAVFPVSNQLV